VGRNLCKKTKEKGLNTKLHIVEGNHSFKSLKGVKDIIKEALK
jgi:hypothetical protein